MRSSTANLVLAPDAAIDLQVHTIHSDGTWLPEDLLDHLVSEQFGLAAITDHDRVDIAPTLQQLAIEKQMPLLVAVEMTTMWTHGITDILCYGFDLENNGPLNELGDSLLRDQQDNIRQTYAYLSSKGYAGQPGDLEAILAKPCAQQVHDTVAFLQRQDVGDALEPLLNESGLALMANETAAVVEAAHRSGAVCLIAHPGRTDGFCTFDADRLDEFRREIPIDGIEVYYPAHTAEQIAMYEAYAQKHGLLTSSGSDSHGPGKKPIKYRAELSRALLERLGIRIT